MKLEYGKNTRIVVVELKRQTIGFIVDEVNEVLRIPKRITEAPPKMTGNVDSEFITAIGKLEDRLLILLDLEKIFSIDEFNLMESTV
jgi:purine-binding chemotaxis protein CheW